MTSAEVLRSVGLRVTRPRLAVMDALADHPHNTAAGLAARLPSDCDGEVMLSKQGLYNVLDDLLRAGLLRRIEPAGSATRYEVRVGDNHHHMVCRSCGAVADVACATGSAPCLDPSDLTPGFVVDEAEVVWWGSCGACAGPSTPSSVRHHAPKALSNEGENND